MPKEYDIDVDNVLREIDNNRRRAVNIVNEDKELEKWLTHGTQGSPMTRNEYQRLKEKYGKNVTATDTLREISKQAICPRCESKAYRDHGWNEARYARCPKCGWSGRTITIKEYIDSKMYK